MNIDKQQIREGIQKLLQESGRPVPNLTDDQSLFLSGLLDSLALIRLINWLEKEFGYRPDGTFNVEKFDSIQRIIRSLSD